MLDASEAFSAEAESAGARASPALRSTLQQQCKAALDALHSRAMSHLSGARCRVLKSLRCRAARAVAWSGLDARL